MLLADDWICCAGLRHAIVLAVHSAFIGNDPALGNIMRVFGTHTECVFDSLKKPCA